MNIDEKIESHFNSKLEEEILDWFGFEHNWRYLPLRDDRDVYWKVSYGEVYYGEEKFTDIDAMYSGSIIHDQVVRKGDYVLIAYDTQCDGNKYLGLFIASKELKEEND